MGTASKISIMLIKGYKYMISPFLGKSCRFEPSCSTYALEAFSKYGFFHGFKLSFFRIINVILGAVMDMIQFLLKRK